MIGIKHNTIKIFDNSFTVAKEYLYRLEIFLAKSICQVKSILKAM